MGQSICFGMRIASCLGMSTPIQILALCLACVGCLFIAIALARVILEVVFAVMYRGLPTPQTTQGKGKLLSADLPSSGNKAIILSDYRAVVCYRLTLRLLEDRVSFQARQRAEGRGAPRANRGALSESGNGHLAHLSERPMLPI